VLKHDHRGCWFCGFGIDMRKINCSWDFLDRIVRKQIFKQSQQLHPRLSLGWIIVFGGLKAFHAVVATSQSFRHTKFLHVFDLIPNYGDPVLFNQISNMTERQIKPIITTTKNMILHTFFKQFSVSTNTNKIYL
jgi:hypothetical protein